MTKVDHYMVEYLDDDDSVAFAAFIVTAVNCHDALVELLTDARHYVELWVEEFDSDDARTCLGKVDAALASIDAAK